MTEGNVELQWLERELQELRAREAGYRAHLSRQEAEALRLHEYAHSLHKLLQRRPPLRSELPRTLSAVANLSAQGLRVARSSVWLKDPDRPILRCVVLIEGHRELPAGELSIDCESCPHYLLALTEDSAVAVSDVYDDARTQELAPYLRQHQIGALLDIPIVIPGQLLGVVCHEHVGGPRAWQAAEIELASNVGRSVALALETERRINAEYVARGSEAKYRSLVESLPVTVYSFDASGKLQYVSPQAVNLGGVSVQRWLEQGAGPWLHRIHPDDRAHVRMRFERGIAGGFPEETTYRVRFDDGRTHFIRDTCRVVRDPMGEVVAIQGVLSDVTENIETQRARDEIERRYRTLLDNVDVIAVALDAHGHVTFANDAFLRLSGLSRQDLIGLDWFEAALAPEHREQVRGRFLLDMARDTVAPRFEVPIRTRSGQRRQLLVTNTLLRTTDGKTEGTLSLAFDVTDRRNLESQLMQQTKLESLGRLAAGVAHDFNNLLTIMLGQLDLLRSRITAASTPTTNTMFEVLSSAMTQAADLTRSLLVYGRKQATQIGTFVLDDLVRESWPLLQASAAGGPSLSASLNAPEVPLSADRGRLRQVLLNLVGNAVDATQQHGSVRVSTHPQLVEELEARRHGAPRGGEFVVLTVADDGHGMDATTLASMFDPFFTTKTDGRGTGLGLAICQTIVGQMGGYIDVASEPGRGATFRVYLPVRERTPRAALAAPPEREHGSVSRRILVVGDAPACEPVESTLRDAGYKVFAVPDIRGATEVLGSAPFDLLITDLNLADGSGAVLARSARRAGALKVVLMADSIPPEDAGDATLIRPFAQSALLSVVAQTLT